MHNLNGNVFSKEKNNLNKEIKVVDKPNDTILILSHKLETFYEEYKKQGRLSNVNKLRKQINSSMGILKTSKLFHIPLLGLSNAGKSTILNDLIGCNILPVEQKECTQKGILIRYWNKNYPIIRKTRFIKDAFLENYYFKSNDTDKPIAIGLNNIHRILDGANGKDNKEKNNEENFFYEIFIKIKFVDDNFQIDNILKEKICFIDLPGFGTNNIFEENDIYSHLMKSCNIFLFIVFNNKLKEDVNQKMLDKLYTEINNYRGMTAQAFINKSIFVINCDKDQDKSSNSLNEAKNDIINIINDLDEKNFNDINVSFFDAKYYEKFLFKLQYYSPNILNYEYYSYIQEINRFWKFLDINKNNSFHKFLIKRLINNLKDDFNIFKDEELKNNEEIEKNLIKECEKNKEIEINKSDIKYVAKLLSFAQENIYNSDLLHKSNFAQFEKNLKISIE